jgi:hypothetical protein
LRLPENIRQAADFERQMILNDEEWKEHIAMLKASRLATQGIAMATPTNPADGTKVVIQNGQRVTGPLSEQEAETEAKRRNALAESGNKPVPEGKKAQVKTNLFG